MFFFSKKNPKHIFNTIERKMEYLNAVQVEKRVVLNVLSVE